MRAYILLAALLVMPVAGMIAAAAEPAAAARDPKVARIEKRLEANAKSLETQRAKRDAAAATVQEAEDGLAKLAAQLKLIDELSAQAGSENAASGDNQVSPATTTAIDEANAAAVPLQRGKREWTRIVNDGGRLVANLDRGIASLEADRGRIERELDKARVAAGGLLAE